MNDFPSPHSSLLHALVEGTADAVYVKDLHGRYVLINAAGAQCIGRPVRDIIGKDDAALWAPQTARQAVARDRAVLDGGKTLTYEETDRDTLTGTLRTFLTTKGVWHDPQGRVAGVFGISHDITARKAAEDALWRAHDELEQHVQKRTADLARAETKYRAIFENATEGIFQTAPDGRLLTANPALARMLGYDTPGALLANLPDVDDNYAQSGSRTAFLREMEQNGQVQGFESQVFRSDGSIIWMSENTRAVRGDDGSVLYYEGTAEDITARKAAQEQVVALNRELVAAYDATIEGWSLALDLRDKETEGHCRRVTDTTIALARQMGLPGEQIVPIRRGALLHDIGKMGVPDAILLKPGPLTDEEWVVMRRHPTLALEMLSPIAFLRTALDIPFCHHEKWDGTGYPRGLAGEDIPLAARLFAIVDVWDALRSDRPYRAGWPEDKVLAHIASLSGTHFDPDATRAFLALRQYAPLQKCA